jgi:hypothetical protein
MPWQIICISITKEYEHGSSMLFLDSRDERILALPNDFMLWRILSRILKVDAKFPIAAIT